VRLAQPGTGPPPARPGHPARSPAAAHSWAATLLAFPACGARRVAPSRGLFLRPMLVLSSFSSRPRRNCNTFTQGGQTHPAESVEQHPPEAADHSPRTRTAPHRFMTNAALHLVWQRALPHFPLLRLLGDGPRCQSHSRNCWVRGIFSGSQHSRYLCANPGQLSIRG